VKVAALPLVTGAESVDDYLTSVEAGLYPALHFLNLTTPESAKVISYGEPRLFYLDRPYLITFLLLASTIAILETRRWMWLLPPLFLIWANCHGGFFLGWVVCGAYTAEALVRRAPDLRRMAAASGAAVPAPARGSFAGNR